MNLALMLLKKNKTKAKATNVVQSWLTQLSQVDLINFVKLKICLHNAIHDANFDINEDAKVDNNDYYDWIEYLLRGTVPVRWSEGSSE